MVFWVEPGKGLVWADSDGREGDADTKRWCDAIKPALRGCRLGDEFTPATQVLVWDREKTLWIAPRVAGLEFLQSPQQ